MAILKVAQMGHPVLRTIAEPVDAALIPTPEFQAFCEDMLETMYEYDGRGLAAPQVYTSLRVVVATLDEEKGPEFLINPVITPLTEDTMRTVEGCLSVTNLRAAVDRINKIKLEFLDRTGAAQAYELSGYPAVVAQHECDHLDGVIFVDRCDTFTLAFLDEFRRHGALDQWFAEQEEGEEGEGDEGPNDEQGEASDEAPAPSAPETAEKPAS